MKTKTERLLKWTLKVQEKEKEAASGILRFYHRTVRWILMVAQESMRDEIQVRSESLTFLTLFSMLPIIAGAFLVAGIMSKFGPVQEKLQSLIGELLMPIPEDHRVFVLQFIIDFQQVYIQTLEKQGATLGVFAALILVYVAAKVYFNVEGVMNRVWNVEKPRPFFERLKNFVMAMVGLPLFAGMAVTLPSFLPAGLNFLLPFLGLCFWITLLLRTLPNTKVEWKAALAGAVLITFSWIVLSVLIRIYFKFGVSAAYGKAAAAPLVAFWIYLMWLLVMVGAELAYVVHNREWIFKARLNGPFLESALVLDQLVEFFSDRFTTGKPPAHEKDLLAEFQIGREALYQALDFLVHHQIIAEIPDDATGSAVFILKKAVEPKLLAEISVQYLMLNKLDRPGSLAAKIRQQIG